MNLSTNFINDVKIEEEFDYSFMQTQRLFCFDDLKIYYSGHTLSKLNNHYYLRIQHEYCYYPLILIVGNIKFTLKHLTNYGEALYKSSKLS